MSATPRVTKSERGDGGPRVRRAVAIALLVAGVSCHPGEVPTQPVQFNHAIHLNLDIEGRPLGCVDCHAGAERQEHAGMPALRDCLRCHMRPQARKDGTRSEAEGELRELAAQGGRLDWTQVTRNPGHVYAPHRVHVGIARLPCEQCHGDVSRWTEPPTKPDPELTSMRSCMECHREHGAPNTCGTCHR